MDLTSAKLKVTFKDGTSETTTFNLTTEVSSPDNIKFTIPLLNPKIGTYTLTVKATGLGGQRPGTHRDHGTSLVGSGCAKPVDIDLEPGWNLVSLPFQPGNPAINSVMRATRRTS